MDIVKALDSLKGVSAKVSRVHTVALVFLAALIVVGSIGLVHYISYLNQETITYHKDNRTNICFATHLEVLDAMGNRRIEATVRLGAV